MAVDGLERPFVRASCRHGGGTAGTRTAQGYQYHGRVGWSCRGRFTRVLPGGLGDRGGRPAPSTACCAELEEVSPAPLPAVSGRASRRLRSSAGRGGAGRDHTGRPPSWRARRSSSRTVSSPRRVLDGFLSDAGASTRGQQSNTDQQMSFRNRWSSSTSSRIAPGSWSCCHWHSSRPAASLRPSDAAARAALIA